MEEEEEEDPQEEEEEDPQEEDTEARQGPHPRDLAPRPQEEYPRHSRPNRLPMEKRSCWDANPRYSMGTAPERTTSSKKSKGTSESTHKSQTCSRGLGK